MHYAAVWGSWPHARSTAYSPGLADIETVLRGLRYKGAFILGSTLAETLQGDAGVHCLQQQEAEELKQLVTCYALYGGNTIAGISSKTASTGPAEAGPAAAHLHIQLKDDLCSALTALLCSL